MPDLARFFAALADPTRLKLIERLHAGDCCVGELEKAVDAPQPKISRHLAYLRRAGVVFGKREGKRIVYKLAPGDGAAARVLRAWLMGDTETAGGTMGGGNKWAGLNPSQRKAGAGRAKVRRSQAREAARLDEGGLTRGEMILMPLGDLGMID